jgi:hypothetical protein
VYGLRIGYLMLDGAGQKKPFPDNLLIEAEEQDI